MTDKPSLAAALAEVQKRLPAVGKSETAEVEGTTKAGRPFKYKYHYADLASITKAILPLLGQHGLAWITMPTFHDGRFVLVYKLRHGGSDQEEVGYYPLPDKGTPQELGSAITYARRYALCSVTGVAPESDDDDAQAASKRDQWDDATPATPPTDEQATAFDVFRRALANAKDLAEIKDVGGRAERALKDGGITKAQYDFLDRQAARRLAELKQREAET